MDKSSEPVVVYPSEIHKFAYCPRQYFFTLYLPQPVPLSRRLRMLLGTIYHIVKAWLSKRKGYAAEERVEKRVGAVLIRGRPDAYRVSEGTIEIVERKSGKGPRRGVWISDALQATAYGFVLYRGTERVLLRVEYRSGSRVGVLDSEKIGLLLRVIDEIVLVKRHGIVPYANRSPARCAKCPYRDLCEELDRELSAENLYEPGSWLSGFPVDRSFAESTR